MKKIKTEDTSLGSGAVNMPSFPLGSKGETSTDKKNMLKRFDKMQSFNTWVERWSKK